MVTKKIQNIPQASKIIGQVISRNKNNITFNVKILPARCYYTLPLYSVKSNALLANILC